MIEIENDCEFITMIADLIKLIGSKKQFALKIWLNGCESPFEYSDEDDFLFLNEGMRIHRNVKYKAMSGGFKNWSYIFYDNIVNVQVGVKYDD